MFSAFGIDMLLQGPAPISAPTAAKEISMKRSTTWAIVTMILAGGAWAQEQPKPPSPQKEHEWLKQLEGEWIMESEAVMGPGQPPVKCKGQEVVRSLGGFWTIGEIKSDFMGTPVNGIMTIGYDPQSK